jgi:hypothetical protein
MQTLSQGAIMGSGMLRWFDPSGQAKSGNRANVVKCYQSR